MSQPIQSWGLFSLVFHAAPPSDMQEHLNLRPGQERDGLWVSFDGEILSLPPAPGMEAAALRLWSSCTAPAGSAPAVEMYDGQNKDRYIVALPPAWPSSYPSEGCLPAVTWSSLAHQQHPFLLGWLILSFACHLFILIFSRQAASLRGTCCTGWTELFIISHLCSKAFLSGLPDIQIWGCWRAAYVRIHLDRSQNLYLWVNATEVLGLWISRWRKSFCLTRNKQLPNIVEHFQGFDDIM